MIGEWDVVEVIMRVVRVECSPPTIATLHSHNHSRPARSTRGIRLPLPDPLPSPQPRCRRHRGSTDWRTERPSRRAGHQAACRPITSEVEDLFGREPLKRLPNWPADALLPNLEQGVAGQRSIPDR